MLPIKIEGKPLGSSPNSASKLLWCFSHLQNVA